MAAIQLEPVIDDVAANLERSEHLADDAAAAGAEWIVLPEFFTTGAGFREDLAGAALAPDGAAPRCCATSHGATAPRRRGRRLVPVPRPRPRRVVVAADT
jgi:predicted amidohydrolase